MDVEGVVVTAFKQVFASHGIGLTFSQTMAARAPYNLEAVQEAVNEDLARVKHEHRFKQIHQINHYVRQREQFHENQLHDLAQKYAQYLLNRRMKGLPLDESSAFTGQRMLKEAAGRGCDIYPCENY